MCELLVQVAGHSLRVHASSCDNCHKKVDLERRVLIANSPNVLIVHLKRLCLNYETFQTDKINSFMKFPHVLDLSPYSYYEVMGKEGRLPKEKEGEEDEEVKRYTHDKNIVEVIVDKENTTQLMENHIQNLM